jgi:hypothetical protein
MSASKSLKVIAFFDKGALRAGGNGSLKGSILKNFVDNPLLFLD